MRFSSILLLVPSFIAVGLGNPVISKRQCAATLATATGVANELQNHYYNTALGQYNGGELWTDANAYENLLNLMLAAGTTTWSNIITTSSTLKAGANPNTNWSNFIAGSFDDAQWVILAFYKAADYLNAQGESSQAAQFMSSANEIYQIINGQWDATCGGGVWWSSAHTYKNAITNELFLLTSASGFLRNGNQQYLANAQREWAWLSASGMRNAQGLFNDGLDFTTCLNNGQTTWTYNQGVIASGLAALYAATGSTNTTLLDQAEITLDATINLLTTNDILKESCDNANAGTTPCNNDQVSFKGIWTKHVQYYLDLANSATRTAKYTPFLGSQESAVFHFGTNAADDVGSVWYAPNNGGSIFSPESSSSGLAAHVAAAKYGPC